ncbi:MAG: penicillin-binding protein 2 [Gammaproteobacteria bacterium]|nr:penicillin-binding protein 2 [Gammaproteobacteria bacterium]
MKTKARKDNIRKRNKIEEKYSWDRMNDAEEERRSHGIRAIIASLIVLAIFTTYVLKLYEVQISEYEYYATKSDSNRIRIRPIQALRGNIFDRNGEILAKNISTFDLIIKRENVQEIDGFINALNKVFSAKKVDVEYVKEQYKNKRNKNIILIEDISLEEYSHISVDKHLIPEMELNPKAKREYLYPLSTSHVLGYLGKVSDSDIYSDVVKVQEGMTEIGKLGVERFYQNILSGESGYEKLETDALGEIIRTVETKQPKRGDDIYLTIDIKLQNYIYSLMRDKEGSVIVMNPSNGDVLAFVSAPGYDINLFTKSISKKNYSSLLNDPRKPMINRAINGQYPPGSTLKPFVGLIALEEGIIQSSKFVSCSGAYKLPNHKRPFKCWKKDGHGSTDLSYALTQSCDVFFYRISELTGIDTISEQLYKYGFGNKTYIDLYNESTGLIPSRDWKYKIKQQSWYPGETLNVGIGQGYFLATPLQLTLATASLATAGKTFTPHLFLKSIDSKTSTQSMYEHSKNQFNTSYTNLDYLDIVHHAMWRVTNERGVGTASNLKKISGLEFAGKTGTAQVYSLDAGKSDKKKLQDHALFISYAPFTDPEIVVTVIVEHGGGGSSTAAPIARDAIDFYMKSKQEVVSEK